MRDHLNRCIRINYADFLGYKILGGGGTLYDAGLYQLSDYKHSVTKQQKRLFAARALVKIVSVIFWNSFFQFSPVNVYCGAALSLSVVVCCC